MTDGNEGTFKDTVAEKAKRRIKARREKDRGIWFGLGMFGLVGWTVAIPTIAGLALGVWIDVAYPSRFSWTIMCLLTGLIFGCIGAWRWVKREGHSE